MIAPAGSNGEVSLGSTTKPTFLLVLFQMTVVPTLTQKVELPLAPGMLGVAEAESAVRFTSTTQGVVADPQVLAGVHIEAGAQVVGDLENGAKHALSWSIKRSSFIGVHRWPV